MFQVQHGLCVVFRSLVRGFQGIKQVYGSKAIRALGLYFRLAGAGGAGVPWFSASGLKGFGFLA